MVFDVQYQNSSFATDRVVDKPMRPPHSNPPATPQLPRFYSWIRSENDRIHLLLIPSTRHLASPTDPIMSSECISRPKYEVFEHWVTLLGMSKWMSKSECICDASLSQPWLARCTMPATTIIGWWLVLASSCTTTNRERERESIFTNF